MAEPGPRSLDARFGAARAVPTRLEVQHIKATVRARLFGIQDDLTRVGDFTIRRRIGRGGMGSVYEAVDPRGEVVALKTLRGFTPTMLYQLKHEFRSLAGVVHPNLVGLQQLYVTAEQAFFSMEMVRGVDFVAHVRGDLERGVFSAAADVRLRAALRQLVDGVAALHDAGKLHGDLKPSNVLVTAEGRVVVLDFGLVRDIDAVPGVTSSHETFAGTPAYMAPELACGETLRPAGDWYALGVILHQALCGDLPFEGAGFQVLLDKCRTEAPDVRALVRDVPDDLAGLALALLDREPDRRPSAAGPRLARGGQVHPRRAAAPAAQPGALLGREAPLATLEACVDATLRGAAPRVAVVHGPPGSGVSTLLQAHGEAIARTRGALVLHGRCYAREAVPFRAIDPLIDDLTRALLELDTAIVEGLAPEDLGPLLRVFPVLGRVTALTAAPPECSSASALQRRAIVGLRGLLGALARARPLVLVIDDLQWGDEESATVLAEVIEGPDAPPLTLIFGIAGDVDRCAFLHQLDVCGAPRPDPRIAIGPLHDDDAAALARSIVGPRAGEHEIAAVVADAGGSPLHVVEIARHLAASGATSPGTGLDHVFTARLRDLSPTARRVLEVVALAARPIDPRIALQAAALSTQDRAVIAGLRASHFVSARVAEHGERLEIHSRLREAVVARLDAERRAFLHLQLAEAMARDGAAAERLAYHYREAGVREEALRHTIRAGDEARAALALRRAAGLYALALELAEAAERRTIHVALAETLLALGRGVEASDHYFAAASTSSPDDAIELRRIAALTLLRFGAAGRGVHALRQVIRALGERWPRSGALGILELGKERLRLRVRGLRVSPQQSLPVDRRTETLIETLAAAREGLSSIEPVAAMIFQTRYLRRALDLGDPAHVVRALASEAAFAAHLGNSEGARARGLLADAAELLPACGDDRRPAESWALCASVVTFSTGCWRECLGHVTRIQEMGLRHPGSAHVWTMRTCFELGARTYLGDDLAGLVQRHRDALALADVSGDLCARVTLRAGPQVLARLVADDVDAAREDLAPVTRWSTETATIQRSWAFLGERMVDAYVGDAAATWGRCEAAWPTFRRGISFSGPYLRIMGRFWRASAAIVAAVGDASRLTIAAREASALESEGAAWADALAALVRAGVAAVQGDEAAAIAGYEVAARKLAAVDMRGWADAAAWRGARLVGGEVGAGRARALEERLTAQGVQRPGRFMAMLAPGVR